MHNSSHETFLKRIINIGNQFLSFKDDQRAAAAFPIIYDYDQLRD